MNTKSINLAIIGAGEVTNETHLPVWRKIREINIVAICDTNEERARDTAKRWKIPSYYTNVAELFNREEVTLVDICTPPSTHIPLIEQGFEAGCNVIMEKPMAATLEEGKKIMQLYFERKDTKLQLGVIHNWLFHPHTLHILEMIKKGMVGDILKVDMQFFLTPDDPLTSNPKHWCHTLPGGRFGELLPHPVYLLYRLLGDLDIKSVQVTKKGPYVWMPYDELLVNLQAKNELSSIYISLNSPRRDFPTFQIYGKRAQIFYRGYDQSLLVLNKEVTDSMFNRGIDSIGQICQLSNSLLTNTAKVVTGQHKTGHEGFFRNFLDAIISKRDLSYLLEEAWAANIIFFDLFGKIPKWTTN